MKLKRLYYGAAGMLPLQFLRKASPASSVFPYHHIVSDEEVPHIFNLYAYKNTKQFRQDLDFLLKNFEPITPFELVQFIQQHQQLPSKKFLLSFDDGFREIAEVVAPILRAKGVPAIFFINPAFIDNRKMFYRNKIGLILGVLKKQMHQVSLLKKIAGILSAAGESFNEIRTALLNIRQTDQAKLDEIATLLEISFENYLKEKRPWLTQEELKTLSLQGFSIGGHSWDHPYYKLLPLNEQVEQTLSSCDYVRQLGEKTITFSFPHSDQGLSQELFDELLKPAHGIDLLFGIQNQKNEIGNKMIHRFNCERPGIPVEQQVKGVLTYSIIQKIINKQTINR